MQVESGTVKIVVLGILNLLNLAQSIGVSVDIRTNIGLVKGAERMRQPVVIK